MKKNKIIISEEEDNKNAILWIGKPYDELSISERELFYRYENMRTNPRWNDIFSHEESSSQEILDLRNEASLKVFNKPLNELTIKEFYVIDQWIQDKLVDHWKCIIGRLDGNKLIELSYEINLIGEIRNLNGYPIKTFISLNGDGYERVGLSLYPISSKQKKFYVNVLMGLTFIPNPNPEKCTEIDHLNSNRLCNWVRNLEWVSHEENIRRSTERKGREKCHSENSNFAIYNNEQIEKVCKLLMNLDNSIQYIAEITNVNPRTVMAVYKRDEWKYISNKYDFPERRLTRKSLRTEFIENLMLSGRSNKEIIPLVMVEFNDDNYPDVRDNVQSIRRRLIDHGLLS